MKKMQGTTERLGESGVFGATAANTVPGVDGVLMAHTWTFR
jgi:hypothetical protein